MAIGRRILGVVLCGATLLLAGQVLAKVPKQHQGKLYYLTKVEDSSLPALLKQVRGAKTKALVPRAKDKHWRGVLVGFFARASHPGPLTIWLYDQADKGALKRDEPTHTAAVERSKPVGYLVWDMDLDPNDGLNKGRSYTVQVGQIVAKRKRVYARGSLTLGK